MKKNYYIDTSIWEGFMSGVSGIFEHTAHLAHFILQARQIKEITCCNVTGLKKCIWWGSLQTCTCCVSSPSQTR